MPDGYADEVRDALLAKAAQAWEADPALDPPTLGLQGPGLQGPGPRGPGDGSGGDRVARYLRAYYQRVATEDLAPPSRLAAVAQAHARLGLSRPQGRALVQVREPADARLHPVSRAGLVVDIVTDDMPYLVDSVTTELNRHEAEIQVIVHPLLRVRRDVTGALHGPGKKRRGGLGGIVPPQTTESWIQAGRRSRRGARHRPGRARRSAALAGGRQLHLPRLPRVRPRADRGRHRLARRARNRARHPPPRPAGP